MEYVIPALTAVCGFFFLMWQRATIDRNRIERRARTIAETKKLKRHTSTVMQRAIDLRDLELLELDKKRMHKKKELELAAANIANTTSGADVAAAWNQEF
tara:strand:+ start:805 stop:1104 length:300 start_codon:yes stop_codon:yes gene_type:complete